MNMIKHCKEEMNKSINEIHGNINKGMKSFHDIKVETESMKKVQAGRQLEKKCRNTKKEVSRQASSILYK